MAAPLNGRYCRVLVYFSRFKAFNGTKLVDKDQLTIPNLSLMQLRTFKAVLLDFQQYELTTKILLEIDLKANAGIQACRRCKEREIWL